MNERGVPWVEGKTIGQAVRETATRYASHDALVFPELNVRLTWSEFDQAVDQIARGLLKLGFQKGDHFGIWATNWPEWVILQFATARIGVVLVTINPAYRAEELEYAIAQSDIRGLLLIESFKTSQFYRMLEAVCPQILTSPPGQLQSPKFPKLQWIVGLRGAAHPGMLSWQQLADAGNDVSAADLAAVEATLSPSDPINLQYTSGTTGFPKGAVLTHRNLLLHGDTTTRRSREVRTMPICVPLRNLRTL